MSIRGPKKVKLFHNGELCAEMESVKATVDLLVLHDPKQRSWGRVRDLYYEACRNNTALFGFTFVQDSNWESSRAVFATDVETNETFIKPSVGEMVKVIFGSDSFNGTDKISKLCRNGKAFRGLRFGYVNENDGYQMGYGNLGDISRKPVQQLNIATGAVINEFPSITHAAQYIWDMGMSSTTSVDNIRSMLSSCVNGGYNLPSGIYLGYKWRFKS